MLAYWLTAHYYCGMTRELAGSEALLFKDGDTNVRLHSDDHAPGVYFAATVTPDVITFTHLDKAGVPLELPNDPELVMEGVSLNPLVPAAHTRYTRETIDDDWYSHSFLVPTVEALRVANARLQSLGAHAAPLTLRAGDDANGLFTVETMVDALADGEFIISTHPPLFFHDAGRHGLGLVTLDVKSVEILQAVSQLASGYLNSGDERTGSVLARSIVDGYDSATFFYNKEARQGCDQLNSERTDTLFSYILKFARRDRLPAYAWAELIQTVEKGPFTYNFKNSRVRRYRQLAEYYREIGSLLASSERASE